MKHKLTSTILILFFLMTGQFLKAQDKIYFSDQSIAKVRIEKIVGNKIIYFETLDGVEVEKIAYTQSVRSVIWADGTKTEFEKIYQDPSLYVNQKKRGIKVHLFAPLLGHTSLSYEQNFRPGRAIEYTLGIIGLGNNFERGSRFSSSGFEERVSEDQKGIHVAVGYKMYSPPMVRSMGQRYKQLLHGWYLMPKLVAGFYKKNNYTDLFTPNEVRRKKVRFANLMLYGGKQIVFSGSILLDWQVGIGVGWDTEDEDSSHHYAVSFTNSVAVGGGLRLGFVF